MYTADGCQKKAGSPGGTCRRGDAVLTDTRGCVTCTWADCKRQSPPPHRGVPHCPQGGETPNNMPKPAGGGAAQRRSAWRSPLCPALRPHRPGPRLLEHLVRLEEDGWGNRQAEGLGGLEVDDQLELRGLLHG